MRKPVFKLALPTTTTAEPWQQILYSEVYAPMVIDTHGDYMTAETIEKMAHNFIKGGSQRNIDVMHNQTHISACIVESYIARAGDPDFTEGAWVVGMHVEDSAVWDSVVKGELNGLSLEATAFTTSKKVAVTIPDIVSGKTSTDNNHTHTFKAKYNEKGEFVGGITDEVDGHSHTISHPTMTDIVSEHCHKFDSVDGFYVISDK